MAKESVFMVGGGNDSLAGGIDALRKSEPVDDKNLRDASKYVRTTLGSLDIDIGAGAEGEAGAEIVERVVLRKELPGLCGQTVAIMATADNLGYLKSKFKIIEMELGDILFVKIGKAGREMLLAGALTSVPVNDGKVFRCLQPRLCLEHVSPGTIRKATVRASNKGPDVAGWRSGKLLDFVEGGGKALFGDGIVFDMARLIAKDFDRGAAGVTVGELADELNCSSDEIKNNMASLRAGFNSCKIKISSENYRGEQVLIARRME
ncbi:hypothetical protein HYW82_02340 [Candidatus Peregrinibacteria bacterium]|nr:hypothetical protein [Candidatus Peregrinibacteria bacterium]